MPEWTTPRQLTHQIQQQYHLCEGLPCPFAPATVSKCAGCSLYTVKLIMLRWAEVLLDIFTIIEREGN